MFFFGGIWMMLDAIFFGYDRGERFYSIPFFCDDVLHPNQAESSALTRLEQHRLSRSLGDPKREAAKRACY